MLKIAQFNKEKKEAAKGGGSNIFFASVKFIVAPFKTKLGVTGSPHYGALPGANWIANKKTIKEGKAVHVKDVEYEGETIPIYHAGFYHADFQKETEDDNFNHMLIMQLTRTSKDGDEYTYPVGITMEYTTPRIDTGEKDKNSKSIWVSHGSLVGFDNEKSDIIGNIVIHINNQYFTSRTRLF